MQEIIFNHKPVLFEETIESLGIQPEGIYIDGTAGGGGHSGAILERLTTGKLLSIDRDPDAIAVVRARLSKYPGSSVAMGNFSEMDRIAAENGIFAADGVLLDIGVSSFQLDTAERGFSYHSDAPLDMRMSKSGTSAADPSTRCPGSSSPRSSAATARIRARRALQRVSRPPASESRSKRRQSLRRSCGKACRRQSAARRATRPGARFRRCASPSTASSMR